MDDMLRKVLDRVEENRDEMIGFLCELIGKKSVNQGTSGTGRELEAQDWVRARLEEMGFDQVDYWLPDPAQQRPNVVGVLEGTGGGRSLVLQGHVDVVPVPEKETALWRSDPWKGTVRDGRVYGRGSSDTKGGLCCMIQAARAVRECGIRLNGDLLVESVIGEESQEGETIGAAATVDRGHRPDFAVVAEPTNCEIHTGSPGVFMFRLTVHGKSAHTASRNQVIFPQRYGIDAGPAVGVDAVSRMRLFLDLFERLELQWNHRWRSPVLGGGGYPVPLDRQGIGLFTINPSLIEGGTYIGSVPGYCTLTCNVWYPSWVDVSEVIGELEERVHALSRTDDWLREHPPELEAPVFQSWRPFSVPVDHDGVQALSGAYHAATGRTAVHSGFKATCDATWLNERGVPAVTFGPGGLEMGVHGPNEFVPVEELMRCARVYAAMILSWCGTA
ncbi:MAG: M20 family metallopeptidase [Spirochaetota bacterium]